MNKAKPSQSSLVDAVTTLDSRFAELQRLAHRINGLEMSSESELKQAERLFLEFTENGQAVAEDIQAFVAALNEARSSAEAAAQKVGEKAEQLRLRKTEIQEKMDQFHQLNERVSQLNETLLSFKRAEGEELTDTDRQELRSKLAAMTGQLDEYISEAKAFQELGHQSNIKYLQQNADSMKQSLMVVRTKIQGLVTGPTH
jgi:chromosome segregation ATPase